MKISTNKQELIELDACESGFDVFVAAHGDKEAKFSECLASNGWDDIFWLLMRVESQLSDKQQHDLRKFACDAALENVEKIKPYCSEEAYQIVIDYLNNPTEATRKAVWSAVWPAADSVARSMVWSAAKFAADSSARLAADSSARLAADSAAESAAMKKFENKLKELFVKWEKSNES